MHHLGVAQLCFDKNSSSFGPHPIKKCLCALLFKHFDWLKNFNSQSECLKIRVAKIYRPQVKNFERMATNLDVAANVGLQTSGPEDVKLVDVGQPLVVARLRDDVVEVDFDQAEEVVASYSIHVKNFKNLSGSNQQKLFAADDERPVANLINIL